MERGDSQGSSQEKKKWKKEEEWDRGSGYQREKQKHLKLWSI